jgi:hypothetical protein
MQRRTFISATAATAAMVASPMLRAQTLPSGPVRIVVGFPPGGGTDALARVVGQKLSAMWNISVVIENKGGAAGVIAADYVAKQPGDGNTLLMAHINSHALAPALGLKLGYNPERDYVPISMVGVTPTSPPRPSRTWSRCARPNRGRSASPRPAAAQPSTSRSRCSSCRRRFSRCTFPTAAPARPWST